MTAANGQLASQLHEIAWSPVRGPAADPWAGAGGTREERRTGSVQLLAVYSQLIKVQQRRIDLTLKDALEAGTDYGGLPLRGMWCASGFWRGCQSGPDAWPPRCRPCPACGRP